MPINDDLAESFQFVINLFRFFVFPLLDIDWNYNWHAMKHLKTQNHLYISILTTDSFRYTKYRMCLHFPFSCCIVYWIQCTRAPEKDPAQSFYAGKFSIKLHPKPVILWQMLQCYIEWTNVEICIYNRIKQKMKKWTNL